MQPVALEKNYIETSGGENGEPLTLRLSGAWTVGHLKEEERISRLKVVGNINDVIIDGEGISEIDTSGAWLIVSLLRNLGSQKKKVAWQNFSDSHFKLLKMVCNIEHVAMPYKSNSAFYNLMLKVGKGSSDFTKGGFVLFSFFGQLCITFLHALRHPKKFRFKSIVYHINDIGVEAIPIIIVMAFLISIVLGYQGAEQLKKFGASVYAVNLVSISMLRDMGVLITAIMLAGRSASSFAAQIGVMQMNDEVAAMRTMGLDPFEMLIMPRIIAIIIALPALTFLSDVVGLYGCMFVSWALLDISSVEFMHKIRDIVNDHTFYIGLTKAPFFALFIGIAGCLQGMQVRISATELGERTTLAVVQAIFLVILGDALFSILFTALGL